MEKGTMKKLLLEMEQTISAILAVCDPDFMEDKDTLEIITDGVLADMLERIGEVTNQKMLSYALFSVLHDE